MPSTATIVGLILVMTGAAPPAAQNSPLTGPAPYPPEISSTAPSPFPPPSHLRRAGAAEQGKENTPATFRPEQSPRAEALGPSSGSLLRLPSPPSRGVVPVVYESPLPSAGRAAAVGESPPAEKATAAMPRSPHDRESPLALSPPGGTHRAETGKPTAGLPPAITVVGSLAVVLGIFLLFAWGLRRAAPRSLTVLPGEVLEILGRAPLAGRQQLHLLRCGNKLLLVSVTPAGAETLTEITDPAEVDRLAGLCQQARPNSATAAFRQVFQQFNRQHSSSGFAGQQGHGYDDCRLANAGVGSEGLEDRHG